jgi:hypothetical protein
MDMDYQPGLNVAHLLQECLSEWQDTLSAYYLDLLTDDAIASREDRQEVAKLRDQLFLVHNGAPLLFRTLVTLKVSPGVKQLAQSLSAMLTPGENLGGQRRHLLNLSAPFTDRLDVELAAEVLSSLALTTGLTERARRVYLALLASACEGQISDEASSYLQRASKLLSFGFDTECVVMCRAVLEAALADRLDFTELDRLGVRRSIKRPGKQDQFSLADLIYGAERCGIFDPREIVLARKIKAAGNIILHDAPTIEVQAPSLLYQLSRLLSKLYPYEGNEPELSL